MRLPRGAVLIAAWIDWPDRTRIVLSPPFLAGHDCQLKDATTVWWLDGPSASGRAEAQMNGTSSATRRVLSIVLAMSWYQFTFA
jgi:hypothetical protein